jgi:hypothetical protein
VEVGPLETAWKGLYYILSCTVVVARGKKEIEEKKKERKKLIFLETLNQKRPCRAAVYCPGMVRV